MDNPKIVASKKKTSSYFYAFWFQLITYFLSFTNTLHFLPVKTSCVLLTMVLSFSIDRYIYFLPVFIHNDGLFPLHTQDDKKNSNDIVMYWKYKKFPHTCNWIVMNS